MLSIRLTRLGKKKQPTYRVIVCQKQKDPWGDFIEIVGHHNPRAKETVLKKDRVEYWLSVGAQPSDTVHNILVSEGIIKDKKKSSSKLGKKFKEKVAAEAEEKAKAEQEAKEKAEAEKAAAEEAKKAEAEAADAKSDEAEAKAEAPKEEAAPAEETKTEEAK